MDHSWGEILKISKSQLTTYLQCPRKYRFQYVEGRPWEFMPAALAFGKAIHEAAARFYIHFQKLQTKLQLAEIQGEFRGSWGHSCSNKEVPLEKGVDAEELGELGFTLLKLFHEEIQPREIYEVEMPFRADLVDPRTGEISDVKLVGFLDLVEKDGEGNLIVVETKTSAKRYSEGEGENRLDGFTYAYALKQLGLVPTDQPLLIRYDVLVKTKKPSFQQVFYNRGPGDDRRFLVQIQDVLHAIEAQAFHPIYGHWCKGCPFRTACSKS